MYPGDAWRYWVVFNQTGWLPNSDVGLDSPAGRVLVGFRLAYLEREYEATGLAEVAWDAYRLAREQGFHSKRGLPKWILEFLDGVAVACQPDARLSDRLVPAGGAAPGPTRRPLTMPPLPAALAQVEIGGSTGPREEFDVVARVVYRIQLWLEKEARDDPGLAERAQEDIAAKLGRDVSWVRECYFRYGEFFFRPIRLKKKGREFLWDSDYGSKGGPKSGEARRAKTAGIDAAISDKLSRWESDHPPTAGLMWDRLSYDYRNWRPVKTRWEVWVDPAEDRIWQRDVLPGTRKPIANTEGSIAKRTFDRHLSRLRKALAER